MLMQLLAGIACLIAALLQFAVYRDPTIIDTPMRRTARRIGMVVLLVASVFSFHAFSVDAAPNFLYLLLVLIAMSQSLFAMSDLLPHLEKEHPQWTSRLNSSP